METLLSRGSPLFGRFTGQWHLQPLEFDALLKFLPGWKADQRVAAYAILGGVPAYLSWLRPKLSLVNNIRQVILAPGSVFTAEPAMLLADQVREPRAYQAVLQAIGAGAHTLDDIANAALIGKAHLSAYLARLQELRLVERRLPVTIPPRKRISSRMGRYHLTDPFLRFYFRFIAPMRDEVGFRPEGVMAIIKQQLRAYVGATAFEELCRDWVRQQSDQGQLPLKAVQVGSHWGRNVQVDVAAVNWQDKAVLVGECKWGTNKVDKATMDELLESKTPQLVQALPDEGRGWTVHHAFFARAGFTPEARALAKSRRVTWVDLDRLDRDLRGR
jgi:AAA+ ATPase superfamily predicted ATPase